VQFGQVLQRSIDIAQAAGACGVLDLTRAVTIPDFRCDLLGNIGGSCLADLGGEISKGVIKTVAERDGILAFFNPHAHLYFGLAEYGFGREINDITTGRPTE
jgi:hypothetical protein